MIDCPPPEESYNGNWYVLLAGLPKPDEVLALGPGVSLVPLRTQLSVFDLAAVGASGFRAWAILEPFTHACACEIESSVDAAVLPGYDALNRAWLASALLVLRGFSRHMAVACSSYSWNLVAGHQERTAPAFREQLREEGVEAAVYAPAEERSLPQFHGGALDFHLRMLATGDPGNRSLGSEEASWIYQHFEAFNRLASDSSAFRLALEAATDWRFAKEPRMAIARLWAGIEALFGVNSELVFRPSLLCAAILEPRGKGRQAKFSDVKKLYGLRSKAVHGEAMEEKTVDEAMSRSFQLLSELLLATIERGHVLGAEDFDEAIFC